MYLDKLKMLLHLAQVLFAAIKTILRSALNMMLYYLLSRIFNKLFGFHILVSFFCSMYCISKIVGYFKRLWLMNRIKNKKQDEKILFNELSFQSPRTNDKFEIDWQFLLDDDIKHLFPSIVNIPFNNGWLFFATFTIIEYQINSLEYSFITSLIRTIGFFIILIYGSSIRYQTLFERDRKKSLEFMIKNRDEIEQYIVYSNNTIPIASVCLQILNISENPIFMVQLCQVNSKFDDYFYDITNYTCQNVIERIKIYGNEKQKSIRLIWSLPTCKKNWVYTIKANKFILRNTYKDFSFMPLVNSYVEQYEYIYEYKNLSSEILDDTNKDQ